MTGLFDKPMPVDCKLYSDFEVAESAAGNLDEACASLFFDHLAICHVCQERMLAKNAAICSNQLPELPGADESDAAIRDFVARFQITTPEFAEYHPGDSIDQYQVISRIGKGGTSIVYLCLDSKMDRRVAVKVFTHPSFFRSIKSRQFQEARSLGRLDHPWIVKAFEINSTHFPSYIVMEFIAGGTSRRLLKQGPLAPRQAARLVAGVAHAIQHAHQQGVLHRDIKPSNLLVVEPFDPDRSIPDNLSLKVSDFGLACSISADSRLTSTAMIVGTPAYMSPEQARGNPKEIGQASDIYSLGIVLYEYLIGRQPLVAENALATLMLVKEVEPVPPRHIRPSIHRDLDTICQKCLRKDPAERYPTAEALAEDLERFLEGRPILARPIGPISRLYRWCWRKPSLAAAIGTSLVLLAALVMFSIRFAVIQRNLRQEADNNATLFKQAARQASEESDFSRNLFITSIRNSEGFLKEIKASKNLENLSAVSEKVAALNKTIMQEYIKRSQISENLRGDGIELLFRDAIAFRGLGYTDEAYKILNRLIDHNLSLPPTDPDFEIARKVAIKSATYIAYTLRQDGKNKEALALLDAFIRKTKLDFRNLNQSYIELLNLRSCLDTYMDALRDDRKTDDANALQPVWQALRMRLIELDTNQTTSSTKD
jgi:serine/threonine protein kinase